MIEITYTGEPEERDNFFGGSMEKFFEEENAKSCIERDWLPQLQWMKSLEKLVLIKLGPFRTTIAGERVISRLLDALICRFLFPPLMKNVKPTLRPHRCIWIQDFEVWPYKALDYADPECLQSYRTGAPHGDENDFKSFHNLVQLDGMVDVSLRDSLLPDLSKLKYFTISSFDDEEVKMNSLSFWYYKN